MLFHREPTERRDERFSAEALTAALWVVEASGEWLGDDYASSMGRRFTRCFRRRCLVISVAARLCGCARTIVTQLGGLIGEEERSRRRNRCR
jgi:hypothetical protein